MNWAPIYFILSMGAFALEHPIIGIIFMVVALLEGLE